MPKVIVTVISSVLVAFGFARFNLPGKKLLFALLIATVLLPKCVLLIPQYLMFREFGWLDTFLPLYVPSAFATDGFFVFMIVQFMRSLPPDMEEAAVIDGCNSLQVLWHVVVPMIMPAVISVALFQFMWTMNDFLGPLIYLSSVEKYPVSLALKMSIDVTEATSWNQMLAMSTIALLPSLVVFFVAQRYFIEGTTLGCGEGMSGNCRIPVRPGTGGAGRRAAVAGTGAKREPVKLRLSWWGGTDVHRAYAGVGTRFERAASGHHRQDRVHRLGRASGAHRRRRSRARPRRT